MPKHLRLTGVLLLLLVPVFYATDASGQIVPRDTVYQKPSLPTGPPVPTAPPQPASRPIEETQVIKSPPLVIIPDSLPEAEDQPERLAPIERLYFGGSFGLQFGTYTNISLLPTISYKLTNKLGVGIGAVYHYIREADISLHNYGGRGLVQVETFTIGEGNILLHGEVEVLSQEYLNFYSSSYYQKARNLITLPMIGAGYRQRIGEKASFDLLLLYNINDDPLNPYNNPVFRASFNFPFKK